MRNANKIPLLRPEVRSGAWKDEIEYRLDIEG